MPSFDLVVGGDVSRSPRARQLEAMFDVPPRDKMRLEWKVKLPIEDEPWKIGLITGPSGCGKTLIARKVWGEQVDRRPTWSAKCVLDDFDDKLGMEAITSACMAVGFNTIPAWLRPFNVLSNGEQFRVTLARRLLEDGPLSVVDEFTSFVDRQVAKIASHAVQKYVRAREDKQFVAVTCHHDVIDWLRPDWIYDPSTRKFARGSLRQRPKIDLCIGPVPRAAWELFAPFHYLTADLSLAARCWGLWMNDRLAAFAGVLFRPVSHDSKGAVYGISRLVTLPDFQGLGLAPILADTLGSIYTALGARLHAYPAHPALIRSFDKSKKWMMMKRPGTFSVHLGKTSSIVKTRAASTIPWKQSFGSRPCAMFRYNGEAIDRYRALQLMSYWTKPPKGLKP